jgi:type IV secretion system protein VirB10
MFVLSAGMLPAQGPGGPAPAAPPVEPVPYTVEAGSKVLLSLINSISTKHTLPGDRVYLETAFPILVNGRIVIPVGSYVAGVVTQVKKPGRVKGLGELYIRFDSLTLPNGVTRDFRARIGGMDGAAAGRLDPSEGKVVSDSNKAGDARTVAETTVVGTSVGAIAGNAVSHAGMGIGIGSGAGAAAGLVAILATRGPDAVLAKGATVEMVLDRNLTFTESEMDFGSYQPPRAAPVQAAPGSGNKGAPAPIPLRRIPL